MLADVHEWKDRIVSYAFFSDLLSISMHNKNDNFLFLQ